MPKNPSDKDDQNDDRDTSLDGISDEDAERLLDDPDDTENDDADEHEDDVPGRTKLTERDLERARQDALKWRNLARKHERESKARAAKLAEYDDASKSESQRLTDRLAEAERRAERAEFANRRREIAEERAPEHATPAQIRAVAKRLSGESDDDLADAADELFALLAPEPAVVKPRTTRRPEERLARPRGGTDPEDDDIEDDPRKLAELISRGR